MAKPLKPAMFKRILNFIAEQSTFNTANVLIFTTSAGWLASSLAQIVGIVLNKNYTKEEKSFMIPQELADAAANIGSFLLVTKSLKALTTKMVETAKLTPRSIQQFLAEKGLEAQRGNFDFNVTAVEGFNELRQTYNGFKTVAESTAAIIGGVLSSNIITPILRNKIAANRQKKIMGTLTPETKPTTLPSYNTITLPRTTSTPTGQVTTPRHTFDDFRNGALRV